MNICILITCAYLFNLIFKYTLQQASWNVRQIALVAIFISSGWLTMFFGVRISEHMLFDLRALPLIFGTLFFRKYSLLLIIGLGIALARYTITGISPQAFTGSMNILLLSFLAAFLVALYQKRNWSYKKKALISILSINTLQVIGIASFGAVKTSVYLATVGIYTYPTGLILSAFFVFIIRDFYSEQLQANKIRNMNIILRKQTKQLLESKRELEQQAHQLTLTSTYKSQFIANMSHEFKTPLNCIIVLSELIREHDDPANYQEINEYAGIIHTSGNELLFMLNSVLDLSKIEAGKMDIVWQPVVMEELVYYIRQQFQPLADAQKLRFDITAAPDVPAMIRMDAQKLNQILRNLLMNAIKFTEQGSIKLEVEVRPHSDASANWIVFTVEDTGIGIASDKQQLIFEAFQQGDGASNRKYGGTGLGLSISLQLAKLLGGTLSLQSEKDQGSRFSLSLPLHEWDAQMEEAEE
ncbi:sensor histidine kinase [Paenibacillus ferrarius]|uniref:sensor histidine kinase n=1 Tax=Paenibacillus ferrarius TaxID=1469647 RepID=UPI0009A52F09|nr:HAMP domain-containing sensor histidine kinase [Paenibacillus ferrarius]